jgi:hypothetical protein
VSPRRRKLIPHRPLQQTQHHANADQREQLHGTLAAAGSAPVKPGQGRRDLALHEQRAVERQRRWARPSLLVILAVVVVVILLLLLLSGSQRHDTS